MEAMKPIGQIIIDIRWFERLRDLARRVERNVPNPRDPERYHTEKSEIVHELEELAQERQCPSRG